MDQWGVDMIVSGSQKALMCPPGLAFVTASERAYEKMRQLKQKPFYLNLLNYKEEAAKGTTPATPAVSLIYGLQEALNIIEEEGLNQVFERHMWLKKMTRAAVTAAGLPLLTTEEDASPTVTAITETPGFQPEAFRKTARETYGLILAGGQKKLKGRLVRFGHMGACSFFELIQSLFLFEMTLKATGHPVPPGTMVQAAEEVLS
jgi:aspartate aminotransferase-like enzyme